MAEYVSSYAGKKIDDLLSLVDNDTFAANDIVMVSDTEPDSETCMVWVESDSNGIKNIWFRV